MNEEATKVQITVDDDEKIKLKEKDKNLPYLEQYENRGWEFEQ